MYRFVNRKEYQSIRLQDWEHGCGHMGKLFGFRERQDHFFHMAPIPWTTFTEPQITRRLVHFLTEFGPESTITRERFRCVLQALGIEPPKKITHLEAHAEKLIPSGRRIDIYLEWRDDDGRFCNAAIEAKFGHTLTPGQMAEYRKFATNRPQRRAGDSNPPHLIVLTPARRSSDLAAMQRNRDWRFMSWRRFLLSLAQFSPTAEMQGDFSSYLRTVWRTAYNL